jgi:hypothetical protein
VSQKSSAVRTVGRESMTASAAQVRTPVHAHSYTHTHKHAPGKVPTLHMKPPISGIEGFSARSPCVHQCRCELSPVLKLQDGGIKRHHVANSHTTLEQSMWHQQSATRGVVVMVVGTHKGARHSARLCGSIIKSTSHHKANEHHGLATPFCDVVAWLECGPAWQDCELECTSGVGHTVLRSQNKFLRRMLFISLSGHTCTSPTQCKTSLSQVCGVRKVARTTRNATCKASEGVQMGWAG